MSTSSETSLDTFVHNLIFKDTLAIHGGAWQRCLTWDTEPVEERFRPCFLCLCLPSKDVYSIVHFSEEPTAEWTATTRQCTLKHNICSDCVMDARKHLSECPICREKHRRIIKDDFKTQQLATLKNDFSTTTCPECSQIVCRRDWSKHRLKELEHATRQRLRRHVDLREKNLHLTEELASTATKLSQANERIAELETLVSQLRTGNDKKRKLSELRQALAEEERAASKRKLLLDDILAD